MTLKSLNLKILMQMNRYSDTVKLITLRLEQIMSYDKCGYDTLLEAEKYSVTAGGKHLRGLILLETAKYGGITADNAVDFACAVEMVHTYSLIHDDLPEMDDDDLRRGMPTCHKKFGTAIALLAGDALLTKAFSVISNDSNFDCDKKIECIRILSNACGEHGMLAGQTMDKLSENKQIDIQTLTDLHNRKTTDMFCAAVKMGCVLGNIPHYIRDQLVKGMSILGLAFQIKDDILDITSDTESLGKPVKSDQKCNKSTFVSTIGLEKSCALLDRLVSDTKMIPVFQNTPFFNELANFFINRKK